MYTLYNFTLFDIYIYVCSDSLFVTSATEPFWLWRKGAGGGLELAQEGLEIAIELLLVEEYRS